MTSVLARIFISVKSRLVSLPSPVSIHDIFPVTVSTPGVPRCVRYDAAAEARYEDRQGLGSSVSVNLGQAPLLLPLPGYSSSRDSLKTRRIRFFELFIPGCIAVGLHWAYIRSRADQPDDDCRRMPCRNPCGAKITVWRRSCSTGAIRWPYKFGN